MAEEEADSPEEAAKEKLVVQSPAERMPELFELLHEIALAGEKAVFATKLDPPPLVRFDASILMRAVNTLKSIRVLLEHAHWELASAGARQLFELLVNLEFIGSRSSRNDAALKFTKFGLLQVTLHQLKTLEYDDKTGRKVDPDRKQRLAAFLEGPNFQEFRGKRGQWARSWSGKNTRQLAKGSSRPLRMDQYELLFSSWSEQTHASPGALLPAIFGHSSPNGIDGLIAQDTRETVEVAGIAISLLAEIWWQLPNIEELDRAYAATWFERLFEIGSQFGAVPPSQPQTASEG